MRGPAKVSTSVDQLAGLRYTVRLDGTLTVCWMPFAPQAPGISDPSDSRAVVPGTAPALTWIRS